MKQQLLLVAAMAIGGFGSAYAQTDVTSTYIDNADFSQGTPVSTDVFGYAKDKGEAVSGPQAVEGWTSTQEGDAKAGGLFAYGSGYQLRGNGKAAPETNPSGEATGNALGIFAVWSSTVQYTQAAKTELPAGDYTLSCTYYNQSGTANTTNLIGFVEEGGTAHYLTNTTFTMGEWTTVSTSFILEAATSGTFSIGYTAGGSGSGSNPMLFIDNIKLVAGVDLTEFNKAKEEAQALLEANPNVTGEAREALEKAVAVADPTSVNALNEAVEAIKTARAAFEAAVAQYDLEQAATAYNQVIASYKQDATDRIGSDITAWTNTNINTNKSQHWDGTDTSIYYEQKDGWNLNSWTAQAKTEVTLPAGKYALVASGRGSASATLTMSAGGNSLDFHMRGDAGKGIAIDGTATFAEDSTYANDNNGRGWEWRALEFESDGTNPTTISFDASANTSHQWVSFTNVSLLYNGADMTSKIVNPTFDNGSEGWTGLPTANDTYKNAEAYQTNFDATQTVSGLTNGIYELTVQGYQRMGPGWTKDAYNAHVDGTEGEIGVELYGNNNSVKVKCLYDEYMTTKADNDQELDGKFYANSLKAAKAAFDQGLYKNTLQVIVNDGTLKLGVRGTNNVGSGYWACFDNFTLTYWGPTNTAVFLKNLQEAIDDAKAYNVDVKASATLVGALSEATAKGEAIVTEGTATEEEITAATAAIKEAMEAVQANAAAYVNLGYIKTRAALYDAGHYSKGADVAAKLEAIGEGYTEDTPTVQANITALEDLMAAAGATFTPQGEDVSDKIANANFSNTHESWEGEVYEQGWGRTWYNENKCSEVYQGTFDLYQTITGLDNGDYEVAIQAFQRAGGNDEVLAARKVGTEKVEGYLYANDAEQGLKSVFDEYLAEAAVSGNDYNPSEGRYYVNGMAGFRVAADKGLYWNVVKATVTDGTLKIGIKNTSSANGYWNIFDTMKLYKLQGTSGINSVKDATLTDGKVYNLNGQLVGKSLGDVEKGIYIINGKKVMK